jgi:hypothetical protein
MQIYEKIHALVAFRNSGGASSRIASGTSGKTGRARGFVRTQLEPDQNH